MVDVGSHIGLSLTLRHQAGSLTPAYDIFINLTLPNALTLINASSWWGTVASSQNQSVVLLVLIPDQLVSSDTVQVQVNTFFVGGATLMASPLVAVVTYSSAGGQPYKEVVTFPSMTAAHIDALVITLVATNDTLTDGHSLGCLETAEWNLELQGIVGPLQNLIITMETNGSLTIISANVTYIGYQSVGVACVGWARVWEGEDVSWGVGVGG